MEREHGGNDGAAPPVKLTGRLRMPKAIPAHLQQHHDQQQQLDAQFKSDAVRDPSHLDHDSSSDVMMMMATAGDCASGDALQWHRDEHNRFMQALETYGQGQSGDEWKKITAFVQTRSVEEVRQHGRQYLQQLVQELSGTGRALQSINSLGFALTPMAAGAGESRSHDNQNDPNGQNHMPGDPATGATGKPVKQPRSRAKSGSKSTNQSSKNSQQQQQQRQQTTTGVLVPSSSQSSIKQTQSAPPRKNGRKPKVWTFEEDKIFENALASWNSDKPYSWPKIATALPGKTAKDARNRYEKLVGDIAIIEKCEELAHQPHHHPAARSGLSSRISPPPPIQVSPSNIAAEGKGEDALSDSLMLDSPGLFRSSSGGSMRGGTAAKRGNSGSSSMLSPTFLDFLTSEEKQPAASAHDALNLTSSSSSSSSSLLLPSPEYSRRPPSSSALPYGGRSSAAASSYTQNSSSASAPPGRGRLTPKDFGTPRIWQEFLSDDFKFDVKALSGSNDLSGDTTSARTGDGSGHSTISQDMGNVTLLGARSKSPRRAAAGTQRNAAEEAASGLQMECDEPMFEAGNVQEEDEYEDKAESQVDQHMAEGIRKRPRGVDACSAVGAFGDRDGDVEMQMVGQEDTSGRSRCDRRETK